MLIGAFGLVVALAGLLGLVGLLLTDPGTAVIALAVLVPICRYAWRGSDPSA